MEGISVAHSASKKKAPKNLEEIRFKRAAEGHLVAEHHFTHYSHEPEEHKIEPTAKAVGAHVAKHMNLKEQGESEPEPYDKG